MTAQHHHHTVLPIEDLLVRIRACIVDAEAIVSLTINVEKSGETQVFRLNMQSDGNLVALSAGRDTLTTANKAATVAIDYATSINKAGPTPQHISPTAANRDGR